MVDFTAGRPTLQLEDRLYNQGPPRVQNHTVFSTKDCRILMIGTRKCLNYVWVAANIVFRTSVVVKWAFSTRPPGCVRAENEGPLQRTSIFVHVFTTSQLEASASLFIALMGCVFASLLLALLRRVFRLALKRNMCAIYNDYSIKHLAPTEKTPELHRNRLGTLFDYKMLS